MFVRYLPGELTLFHVGQVSVLTSWDYGFAGRCFGPVSTEELRALITQSSLPRAAFVRQAGAGLWYPGNVVAELLDEEADWPPAGAGFRDIPAGPWARFWARSLDMMIATLACTLTAMVGTSLFNDGEAAGLVARSMVFSAIAYPLTAVVINVLSQALSGGTIGKAIFGITVGNRDRQRDVAFFFRRELFVWLAGNAAYIPLAAFIANILQYLRLRKGENASYDGNSTFVIGRPSRVRIIAGCLVMATFASKVVFPLLFRLATR
ncbi:RDD family protein [Rhizobium phaseoli]|uniref:RDD family protein n=1 Tax=Rhizobium phaseoli TaxID=396 RepID=UPI0014383730|nr:RDD family protein [Rhizobium phaseoli]MDK4728702.1 RDD family protein [Rhizobium phaseoli]NKE91110.1 RDD family protein [Rhizobium phaseoli]